jgi:predicted transposase YdaD
MNTFDRLAIETGLAAKWEAEGKAKGEVMGMEKGREAGRAEERAEVARNALAQGATPEFVQKITGLDMQTITSFK